MNRPSATEITIAGANCPWCFNETLEALRSEPGVLAVTGTITGQCLRVDHDGLSEVQLVALVRRHLHADEERSGEHLMVEIEPAVAALHCTHGRADTAGGAEGRGS